MSDVNDPLRLPASIRLAAERLAAQDGVSLNDWIASAVAQKVGSVETAAEFLGRQAGNAQPEDMFGVLALAPDLGPEPGDEMPSEW